MEFGLVSGFQFGVRDRDDQQCKVLQRTTQQIMVSAMFIDWISVGERIAIYPMVRREKSPTLRVELVA